jgi:hypothetical protein
VEKVVDAEEANRMTPHGAVLWATNGKQRSSRARQHLAWNPVEPSLSEHISEIVRDEAGRLGIVSEKGS